MAYVPVPKDLNAVKTKVMFNLTKRQLICFGSGAAVQKCNEHERGIHHYDCRSAAVHAFGYVRKERTTT